MDTIDLTKFCIICKEDGDAAMKTSMELNDKNYKIALCEADVDEASMGSMRRGVLSTTKEIEEIIAKAEKYGLFISYGPPEPQIIEVPVPQPAKKIEQMAGPSTPGWETVGDVKPVVQKRSTAVKETATRGPVQITERVVDDLGETTIQIADTSNRSLTHYTADDEPGFSTGYAVKDCSPCKGKGSIKVGGTNNVQVVQCRRCSGTGVASR